MKRILWVVIVVVVIGLLPSAPANAVGNTNNFYISSYDMQFELSRDSEGRSVLKTAEKITAVFPSFDQNHGIERAIPTSYEGHPVDLTVTKVADEKGNDLKYTTYGGDNNRVVRIGDADIYVHGPRTYVIEYTQRDVTGYFADNNRNEWYWDTNGTGWKVPIRVLTVSVKLDPSLANARLGEPACYEGAEGVGTTCDIIGDDANGYSVAAANLRPGENVTVAFGFEPGTFAEYKQSLFERLLAYWKTFQILATPIIFGALVTLSVMYSRRKNRLSEQNPIVAEYTPPKDASVMVASQTISVKQGVFTAQLIDLAVRRFVSIIETREKSFFRNAEYDIEILQDVNVLPEEEKEIISDMFGHVPNPGERKALKSLQNSITYSMRTMDNDKKLKKLLEEQYGVREKSPERSKLFKRFGVAFLVLGVGTLTFPFVIVSIVSFVLGHTLRPLSDKGLALRRYILGLDKYIKASEAERLAFLQGPDTAQKIGYEVDTNNPGQIVKLYERALPYAILFGREKQWSKRLGEFYEQSSTRPDWYTGAAAFNAATFASSMHSFSQASTYSSGSSSSSGGSSGGGSSGGGGGGGGGGGW